MEIKNIYELKQNSLKTKYKGIISNVSISMLKKKEELLCLNDSVFLNDEKIKKALELQLEDIKGLKEDFEKEISELKEKRDLKIQKCTKRMRYYVLFADFILLFGISILVLGIYYAKIDASKSPWDIICIILGGAFLLSAGVFFALAEKNREERHDVFVQSISNSEIASTKLMMKDFYLEYEKLVTEFTSLKEDYIKKWGENNV